MNPATAIFLAGFHVIRWFAHQPTVDTVSAAKWS